MKDLVTHYFFIVFAVIRVQFVEIVNQNSIAFQLGFSELFHQLGIPVWGPNVVRKLGFRHGDRMRKTRNQKGFVVRLNREVRRVRFSHGVLEGYSEHTDALEDDPGDSEFNSEVGCPRVEHVGEDAIGGVGGDELFNFFSEEVHAGVDFGGGVDVIDVEQVFDAVGEAYLFGRERDGVGGDVVAEGGVFGDGGVE